MVLNIEMPHSQHQSWINLAELKAQIAKRLGQDKARKYFSHLTRFLSQKLSKIEFDKLCYFTIGQENHALHNQFIRSILKNAYNGKVPPSKPGELTKKVRKEDGYHQNSPLNGPKSVVSPNGDTQASYQTGRSVKRDPRHVDRLSPLGSIGGTDIVTDHQGASTEETLSNVVENGNGVAYDLQRPTHRHHDLTEQPADAQCNSLLPPLLKRPRLWKSPHETVLEDVGQFTSGYLSVLPICAPLGIPFCTASLGGACRVTTRRFDDLPDASSYVNSFDSGELPDAETLRRRMDPIAEAAGLRGVTIDCANLLNNGLDAYLKKLIRLCTQLESERPRSDLSNDAMQNPHNYRKVAQGFNCMWQNNTVHCQTNIALVDGMWEIKSRRLIFLEDLRVAMELNPQQLGDRWPLLLEKISFCASEH